jgi:hypothetical protein
VPWGLRSIKQGREVHQVLIVWINDGVTEAFGVLLDLPPGQRVQTATAVGSVEVDPGAIGTVFLRLVPGCYGAGDFLSQGTAAAGAELDEIPPPHRGAILAPHQR